MHVLGLCVAHHRAGRRDDEAISRHPWRRAFEAEYGTEAELMEWVRGWGAQIIIDYGNAKE